MKDDLDKLFESLHFRYIIGIFCAITIVLSAIAVGNSQKLFEYVNAGVAITSLTLAVFAIWMTAKSGEKNEKNTQELRDVVVQNRSVSNDLTSMAQDVHQSIKKLDSSISKYSSEIENLQTKLDNLPKVINAARQRTKSNINDQEIPEISEELIAHFLDTSSLVGLMLVWAGLKLSDHKKSLSIARLEKADEIFNADYANGFIVAASCLALFEMVYETEGEDYKFENIHHIDINQIEKRILDDIQNIDTDAEKTFRMEAWISIRDFVAAELQ